MRLDKYLKVSRLIKRRTVANEVADAGRILINGKVAKASAAVAPGEILRLLKTSDCEEALVLAFYPAFLELHQRILDIVAPRSGQP